MSRLSRGSTQIGVWPNLAALTILVFGITGLVIIAVGMKKLVESTTELSSMTWVTSATDAADPSHGFCWPAFTGKAERCTQNYCQPPYL